LLALSQASASVRVIPSTDRVPLGDWTYDAMMKLAADGLVPGLSARVFEGDRLFDRMEMAGIVASIIRSSEEEELGFSQTALINHLVSEYKPELMAVDGEALQKWSDRATNISLPTGGEVCLTGYLRGMAIDDSGDAYAEEGDSELTYRISPFFNLSDRVFAIATAADKEEQFFQQLREDSDLDKGFIRGFDGNFVWSIGREYQNWGPAYTGSLILSDNSPSFTQFRGAKEMDFGKLFGRVKVTQFVSAFNDDNKDLLLFGRRYEKPLSSHWQLGISETAKVGKTPNPLILVLPYYLYQHIFIDIDEEFNTLYAADFTYHTPGGSKAFFELLIDDITAPRIFGPRHDRPRKTGYTFGFRIPKVFGGDPRSSFLAEYIHVDRLTYGATRVENPELAYTHDGDTIGHAIGPNAKAIYVRGEHYLSDKFSLVGEYLNQRQTEAGEPERGREEILSLMASYDIAPDKSISVRVAPYEIAPPGGASEDGTKYEVRASFAF
jgi:hypothetical protein